MGDKNKMICTTHISEKGQVVIPKPIRKILNVKAKTAFTVRVKQGVIQLKPISKF